MRPNLFVFCTALTTLAGLAQADALSDGFAQPPRTCSIVPLWSWNGRLEPDQLCWQIDQMVDKGVYGAFMHARAGLDEDTTPYFSEGFWRAVETSVEHGAKVGFGAWLYDEDCWPSGSAGGRTIAHNPERNRRKGLRRVQQKVQGGTEINVAIPDALYVVAGRIIGKDQLASESLTDITEFNSKDKTATARKWPCPQGQWLITGYVPYSTGGINYLNRQTVRDFMDITHEQYAKRVGDQFGKAVPGLFFDEIDNTGVEIVWSEDFAERFKSIKGYDLGPVLPALNMDIGPRTPKIRCDYYDVFTTIYEEAWFKQISEWCDQHHLALTGHTQEDPGAYKNQGDYYRTIHHLQIPGTDNEDFRYSWPRVIGSWKPKQMASVCHIYGRPLVGVEAMGGAGWSFTLDAARYGHNMLAAYGINFYMTHLFHYAQDRPSNVDDWPNSWFFQNPYWKYFKTFADHSSRLTYMLTSGDPVVDVAILYPLTNMWAGNGGAAVPEILNSILTANIDADLIDPNSLVRAEIADSKLNVAKMHYRVLVVPAIRCMRQDEARQIAAFASAGGTVIVLDRWPSDSMEVGADDPQIAAFRSDCEKKGLTLTPAKQAVARVLEKLAPDFTVGGEQKDRLHHQHVHRDGREIYWLANDSGKQGTWRASFRAVGTPSLWRPEDGSIQPITAFVRKDDRTQCSISLDKGQGVFVVLDTTTQPAQGGVEILATNLLDAAVALHDGNSVRIKGSLPPDAKQAQASVAFHDATATKQLTCSTDAPVGLAAITLDKNWSFLPVTNELDYEWRTDIKETELPIPVMRANWERAGQPNSNWQDPALDDSQWRQIKVLDTLHPTDGARRYRSRWQARFISWYDIKPFRPVTGGKGLQCRKSIELSQPTTGGWLAVICESQFELDFNGQTFKGKGGKEPQRFDLPSVNAKPLIITITAQNARAILAEGNLATSTEQPMLVTTDSTWECSLDGKNWQPAWEYVAPPEKPYGEPTYPTDVPLPNVVWYRQPLPAGAISIKAPKIEGQWQAWVDGKPVNFDKGQADLPSSSNPKLLAIRVDCRDRAGLLEPVRVICHAAPQPLGSWTDHQLDWYSGRAIYATTFSLSPEYRADGTRLQLDLGKVCYFAEIWLNGRLVGSRIWPPYTADITEFVKPGQNQLEVVVANLLANRMRWDIFDDVKGEAVNRQWHDSNIRRDGWCLESGLIGPVRILPLQSVEVTGTVQD